MNKKLLTIAFLVLSSFLLGSAQNIMAGTIFLRVNVEFDSQSQQVGGFVATYVTYDIYDYYDPAAHGILYYANPTEQIDQDGGFGVNHYLYGYYPGYKADFTTNDYRPNRVLCTFGEHGLLKVYTPTPLQWADPNQMDSITPQYYSGDYDMSIPSYDPATGNTFYSSQQYSVVAYSGVCIQTPTVASVEFQTINSDVTNDNPASLGGGQRIFPDRDNPNDNTTNKRTVRVRAQLNSSGGNPTYTSGARVYFRSFDVDDPSSDTAPIDPLGSAGNDNRGNVNGSTTGELSSCDGFESGFCYKNTDSNGTASLVLTVTMQPGDNFVIAASTDRNYLNGVTINGTGLQDSSGSQLSISSSRAKRTGLLSVWRRLQIEVDSMYQVQENFVIGTIPNTVRLRVGQTVTITLNPTSPVTQLEPNRFEGGRLFAGNRSFPVTCNLSNADPNDDTCNTATFVTVTNTSGALVTLLAGTTFQLFDDDDYNDDDQSPPLGDGTLDGDTGEDVEEKMQTFSYMRDSVNLADNAYAAAYIQPKYDWAFSQGYNQHNIIYSINRTENNVQLEAFLNNHRNSDGDERDDFWISYLFLAYQSLVTNDYDPITEGSTGGTTLGYGDRTDAPPPFPQPFPLGGNNALIYLENCRDIDVTDGIIEFQTSTTAHEIGHQMGLEGDAAGFGIMSSGENLEFVATHINMLRTRVNSPGY